MAKKKSQGFVHKIAFMKYWDNPLQQSLKRINTPVAGRCAPSKSMSRVFDRLLWSLGPLLTGIMGIHNLSRYYEVTNWVIS